MKSEQVIKAPSRAPDREEVFYQNWGFETLKTNINIATEVLKQLITINAALLGGGIAFLDEPDMNSSQRICILLAFIIGLITAIVGVIPSESAVDLRVVEQIKSHKYKTLNKKRKFLYVSAFFTVSGLLVAAIVASKVHFCFN